MATSRVWGARSACSPALLDSRHRPRTAVPTLQAEQIRGGGIDQGRERGTWSQDWPHQRAKRVAALRAVWRAVPSCCSHACLRCTA
eukprot:15465872-Alexandrium_andersonii.AAC.1